MALSYFFEDTEIINELKETYAMYAENFSTWSNQTNGMLQNNIWTALSQANIGANLQHYNPLIDDKIKELFSIPDMEINSSKCHLVALKHNQMKIY